METRVVVVALLAAAVLGILTGGVVGLVAGGEDGAGEASGIRLPGRVVELIGRSRARTADPDRNRSRRPAESGRRLCHRCQ